MTRRYRRRRFYRPYHYRVGMSYNYGSSYSTYGAVQYEDDILLPSSSGRFTNLGTAPVDGNGIVNVKSSAFTSPTQLNFNYSAAAYPAELKKRLNSQEWIAIQKELNQVLIDYPVDYQGFASVTYSEFVWCLLFLLGIIPYCILNSQYVVFEHYNVTQTRTPTHSNTGTAARRERFDKGRAHARTR